MYPVNPLLFRHGGIIGQSHSPPVGGWPLWSGRAWRPQQGHIAWRNRPPIDTSPSTSPLYFSYFPLGSLYLLLFVFAPFPSFSFGVLHLLPLFWEWPSPEKQPRGYGPKYSRPTRQAETRWTFRTALWHSESKTAHFAPGTWEGDKHYPVYAIGLIVYILLFLNKPQSHLLFIV